MRGLSLVLEPRKEATMTDSDIQKSLRTLNFLKSLEDWERPTYYSALFARHYSVLHRAAIESRIEWLQF